MANICQCGCGQELPENSTRQYKRGHKAKLDKIDSYIAPDASIDADYTYLDEGETGPEVPPLSIEDVAALVPDDPEPSDRPETKPPKEETVVKITAAVRRDVEGKIAFVFGMSGQLWAMADPVCGNAFLSNSPEIAKKLTPIICQSPDVVKWLTKSSNFILWIDLFMAMWPVAQMIFMHHIAKTIADDIASQNGQAQHVPPNAYVVQ